jgi:hypothetical protein
MCNLQWLIHDLWPVLCFLIRQASTFDSDYLDLLTMITWIFWLLLPGSFDYDYLDLLTIVTWIFWLWLPGSFDYVYLDLLTLITWIFWLWLPGSLDSDYLDLLTLITWIFCLWLPGSFDSDYLDLLTLITWIFCLMSQFTESSGKAGCPCSVHWGAGADGCDAVTGGHLVQRWHRGSIPRQLGCRRIHHRGQWWRLGTWLQS